MFSKNKEIHFKIQGGVRKYVRREGSLEGAVALNPVDWQVLPKGAGTSAGGHVEMQILTLLVKVSVAEMPASSPS